MWRDHPSPTSRPSVPRLSPARGRWALPWCLGTGKPPESLRKLSSAPGPAVQGVFLLVPLATISFPSVNNISVPSLSCVTFWDSALCHQWCSRNLLFSWVLWPVLPWPALSWPHSALHLMVWTSVWLQNMNPSRPAQPTFHLCLPKDLAKEAIPQNSVDSTLQALASISLCACACVCLCGWSEAVSRGAQWWPVSVCYLTSLSLWRAVRGARWSLLAWVVKSRRPQCSQFRGRQWESERSLCPLWQSRCVLHWVWWESRL